MSQEAIEAAASASAASAASVASKATYAGAGTMIGGWFLSSEFAVLVGLVVGVGGLAVNWYYRHQDNRRAEREHQVRMAKLSRPTDPAPLGER